MTNRQTFAARTPHASAFALRHSLVLRPSSFSIAPPPVVCHFSRVRFLLPIPLLLALLSAGCASGHKAAQQQEPVQKQENSRTGESRRMVALDNGFTGTERWAEVTSVNPNKTFDPSRSSVGGRTYDTGNARVKEFYYDQKAHPGSYGTRDFYGSKKNWSGDLQYAARDANTQGKYAIPNAAKAADTKTATTKEAWDAGKTAATRGLRDGQREFLGPESAKLRTPIDPASQGDWRSAGRESVVNSATSVEKFSTLKQLTIEDIRELLNKNK